MAGENAPREVVWCDIVDSEGHPAGVLIDLEALDMDDTSDRQIRAAIEEAESHPHPHLPDAPRIGRLDPYASVAFRESDACIEPPCNVQIAERIVLFEDRA